MRRWMLVLLFLGHSFIGFPQYSFTGRITDQFENPIVGATISKGIVHQISLTDSSGKYAANFSDSTAAFTFSCAGFISKTQKCSSGQFTFIILERNITLLDETIIQAFERNVGVTSIAASVSVISKTIIDRFPSQSFVTAFNTIPGVKMDERSPGSYRLNIRGNLLRSTFGVRNVKVYWNGIPFTDASGNTYLNELPPSIIGKVEVVKGPGGCMYGAGTGGVVLLNSSTADSFRRQLGIDISSGSYGTNSANASFAAAGKIKQIFSFSHAQTKGYRDQSRMRRDVGNYMLNFPTGAGSGINANFFYSDLYYQTPGGLNDAEMQVSPTSARPAAGVFPGAASQKASIRLKTLYAGLGHDLKIGKYWHNVTGMYGSYTDFTNPTIRNFEKKFERGLGGRTVFQRTNQRFTHSFGGEIQFSYINTSVFGNRLGARDTLQYNDVINARQANLFLQTVIELKSNISVEAGLSYNNFFYGFNRINVVPATRLSNVFKAQLIPRISTSVKVRTMSFYVALSNGFSPPSIDEIHASNGIFNTDLAAETSLNYEAGFKGYIIKNRLYLDMSYYLFSLKNTIVSRRDSSGADFYVNAGKTNQHGFEAALRCHSLHSTTRFINQITGWLNTTITHAYFTRYQQGLNKFDGNRLTGTPASVIGAGFECMVPEGIYLNSNINYTSRIPLNDANTFFAKSYNILDMKLGKMVYLRPLRVFNFYVAYERSFNTPYSLGNDLNAAGNRYYNPSAPHVFTIGAKLMINTM